MKRILIFLIICIIPGKSALSQIVNIEPLSARQTYYKIDARLDPESKIVTGEMEAYRVNKSNDIVPDAEGKNKTLTYRAEDIVDFAWTAWPGYAVFSGDNMPEYIHLPEISAALKNYTVK